MKALTWYSLFPVPVLVFIATVAAGFIPAIQSVTGSVINGGAFRDYCVNLLLNILPLEFQHQAAQFYYKSYDNEILLYLISVAHFGLFLVWITYLVLTVYMYIHNTFGMNQMKSEQKTLRR